MHCKACNMVDSLSAHAVTSTHGERLEGHLVLSIEALVVSRVGLGQKSFRVKNARLDPVVRVILDVLQIHADDVLATSQQTVQLF